MATSLELRAERANLYKRMKELVDSAETEKRDFTAEEETNWTAANTDIAKLDARIARLETVERTVADPETRGRTPGREGAVIPSAEEQAGEYREVYNRYIRFGRHELDPQENRLLRSGYVSMPTAALNLTGSEARAMGVGNQVSAGYLAPDEYERNIIQNMLAFGGMRQAAKIVPTDNGNDWILPVSDDTGNVGELLAEHGTAGTQDVTVGRRVLKAYMYSTKRINVSFQLLQDSAFDIQAWLSPLMSERIARITNTHFTTGTGANRPSGIVNDAGTGVSAATGQTTSVTWDDLINLEHSVDPAYRNNARFMFNDNTLSYLRRIKDGNGDYIWQPGTTAGAPGLINGWPYTINQDMPAMAASARSILFGNFQNYWIRDVRGFFLLRLDELYAPQGEVGFLGFSRHDGALIHAGTVPIMAYVNSAS